MALEKRDATQIVTWKPPLPQRAFRILNYTSTTDNMPFAGSATDGRRYGCLTVDTSRWATVEGSHTPPVQAGEQFQVWTATAGGQFIDPPAFGSGQVQPASSESAVKESPGAPDLFNVYGMTEGRQFNVFGDPVFATWTLANPNLVTVISVQQATNTTWYVYFKPYLSALTVVPQQAGMVTVPMPYSPKYLQSVGHVAGVNYTYTIPGGPTAFTCNLQVEPNYRTDALDPGRIVTLHRGGSCVWEGIAIEPVPSATGWALSANGCGTYGTNFGAWWNIGLTWNGTTATGVQAPNAVAGAAGWAVDAPVDYAIARGMRWVNNGIGKPSGIYLGPVQDPGSLTVTDFLNLLCTGGSLTWELVQPGSCGSFPPGPWTLRLYPLPTDISGNPLQAGPKQQAQTYDAYQDGKWHRTDSLAVYNRRPPDLFLVNTSPIARTIASDVNTLILYYQSQPFTAAASTKTATTTTYATTFVDIPASVDMHGRLEYTLDITNAGAMTQAQAQAIGLNVLRKYTRANFQGPFTVMPGQLINIGGQSVDLALNWCGHACTIQGIDAAAGGEVTFAPITFYIGNYEYDDDTQTATVTPYQSVHTDMSSLVASLYPGKF